MTLLQLAEVNISLSGHSEQYVFLSTSTRLFIILYTKSKSVRFRRWVVIRCFRWRVGSFKVWSLSSYEKCFALYILWLLFELSLHSVLSDEETTMLYSKDGRTMVLYRFINLLSLQCVNVPCFLVVDLLIVCMCQIVCCQWLLLCPFYILLGNLLWK